MEFNEATTSSVLEALTLKMKETSLGEEIAKIDAQIKTLSLERERIEKAKVVYINARDGAIRAARTASDLATQIEARGKELSSLVEKAQVAAREADVFAAQARKPINFDDPISELAQALELAHNIRKQAGKNLTEVRARKEQLKKEGVDLNLDVKIPPSGVSI